MRENALNQNQIPKGLLTLDASFGTGRSKFVSSALRGGFSAQKESVFLSLMIVNSILVMGNVQNAIQGILLKMGFAPSLLIT